MSITIRPWRETDAADLAAALNNEHILNNLRDGLPFPYTQADALAYIRAMRASDPDETFAFAIALDGRAIGSIGVFRQQNIHRQTAELGYYIAEDYWGMGYMTQAIRLICGHIFSHSDILRIYAEPFAYNLASCRALEKAGFRFEGTLRQNAVKNGKIIDMQLYSLLREEWQNPVAGTNPEPS